MATRFARSSGRIWWRVSLALVIGVHDALRELADNLVQEGVWIEVTDRTEWDIREKRDD
jgi:hypothetical protein